MKYILYKAKDGSDLSFAPVESYENCPMLMRTNDGEPMEKVWEIEADTWNEACTKYHEYMGWESYIPME